MNKIMLIVLLFIAFSGKSFGQQTETKPAIDTTGLEVFFRSHPKYAGFKTNVRALYQNHYHYVWHDQKGVTEFAALLYAAACRISEEGLPAQIPYNSELEEIFYDASPGITAKDDFLISCLYFFYTSKVYSGIEPEMSGKTGWFLPRKRDANLSWLEHIADEPNFTNVKPPLFSQYYHLKNALRKYRAIAYDGGWKSIVAEKNVAIRYGDSSQTAAAIRLRLYKEGYLTINSEKAVFDHELLSAISKYQVHHNLETDSLIGSALINSLNIPVAQRIKTISVNMERCRWLNPDPGNEFIAVNIPSFRLAYFRNGTPVLTSRVVVGTEVNKTVVFSGELSQVVFNPYWNVPNSILQKEMLPAIKKNPNFLKQQNMEWHQGKLRQRPGSGNALGHVKFIFPNTHNIYLHDTPQKNLFKEEKRAFSHGCIRVEKACDLAAALMENNYGWTEAQTTEAMQSGKQKVYNLHNKIPVYIAYFTAWVDDSGNVSFYDDLYKRDETLWEMIFSE